jgi:hypothetical protein
MSAWLFYQYVRFVAQLDHLIDRWTPLLCEYTESLFDRLPADKQAWEQAWWDEHTGFSRDDAPPTDTKATE